MWQIKFTIYSNKIKNNKHVCRGRISTMFIYKITFTVFSLNIHIRKTTI